jgi:putative tryptophan/tyrosine transport system substrate-binding protein
VIHFTHGLQVVRYAGTGRVVFKRWAGNMRRRTFITRLGAAAAWPLTARAQQVLPVIALVSTNSADDPTPRRVTAFRKGLGEAGFTEERVTVEYHRLAGQVDRIPALMADLVRRRVAVIATPSALAAAVAARAATTTIPIVFGVNDDPVKLGLVANLARPGGNLTGMNFFSQEATAKRFALLHGLAPKSDRVAVMINRSNTVALQTALREAQDAASHIGLHVDILKACSAREIEAAFGTMAREKIEALFILGDSFLFENRLAQFATLAARGGIATSYTQHEFVEAGGLTSYGTDLDDVFHQIGICAGQILNGAKPADLPVVQSTGFQFAINLQTARLLGVEVPPMLVAQADEVIE